MVDRKDFEVAIVGGGIGGFCAAIGLLRAGVPVKVFEAAVRGGGQSGKQQLTILVPAYPDTILQERVRGGKRGGKRLRTGLR